MHMVRCSVVLPRGTRRDQVGATLPVMNDDRIVGFVKFCLLDSLFYLLIEASCGHFFLNSR